MNKVLNLQTSLFGKFIDIKLETDIVIKLLLSLKSEGFIPGSADIASVDLQTGKMVVDSRLQLISPDKTWCIVFLPDRIDFNYNFQQDTRVYNDIGQLLQYAQGLIRNVFSVFSETRGTRLALNCKYSLENIPGHELKQFCNKFTKPLSVYEGDSYDEWGVRFNARGGCKVSDTESEMCNRITEMMQIEGMQDTDEKHEYSIIVTVDINTLQQNIIQRFDYKNLIVFTNDALHFVEKALEELEKC